ncbi:MAG: DUF3596 domain-containing protein [Coleofasciculaceae cyanobacterium RL_1_1]|nr:DUF3596 domain-containing protein [Coleofasciculaceae cyanobacterium RL_1_1]
MAKSIVSIEVRGKSYDVRFSYAGLQHRLGLGLPNSSLGKLKAVEIASQIEKDILLGDFDIKELHTYKPSYQEKLKAQKATEGQLIIILVWRRYLSEKLSKKRHARDIMRW